MQLPELRMTFADRALLAQEIEQSLRCGRAFMNQASPLPVLSDCTLVLVHPEHGGELRLPAQVVMANEHGTGLSLTTLSAQQMAELLGFADAPPPPPAAAVPSQRPSAAPQRPSAVPQRASVTPQRPSSVPQRPSSVPQRSSVLPERPSSVPQRSSVLPERPSAPPLTAAGTPPPAQTDADALLLDSAEASAETDSEPLEPLDESLDSLDFPRCDEQDLEYGDEPASRPVELQSESRMERLRGLSPAEQLKVARRGELADRLAVERLYGKQVWEALLHNPRLTIPEVAKIARKGTVPRPLLDIILDNAGWTKADAVRRALLSNPKIGADSVLKLLRITPKHELKLIEKGTAYGATVREAARKLLRQ